MRREILKPIGKGKQLLRIEFSTASCYFFVLNLWGKEVGHVCLKILVLMLRDLCNTYIIYSQSSTAVFLAALPVPPVLKVTGRVCSLTDLFDFLLGFFLSVSRNKPNLRARSM